MSMARYVPLFVTSSLPIGVTNFVLESASKEKLSGTELIGNPWVLIRSFDQQIFERPTNAPVTSFQNSFLGTAISDIQQYVDSTFGEEGLGRGPNEMFDFIANDAFGVIDERTARDGTMLLMVQDLINPFGEAELRMLWGRGTEYDDSLMRFKNWQASEKDIGLLLKHIEPGGSSFGDSEAARTRVWEWSKAHSANSTLRWFDFRVKAEMAVMYGYGIDHVGAVYAAGDRDAYDEHGVMI